MGRIGLALSGGGIRAAVFHMGVLKGLAELGLWEEITYLSTVSGASLGIGLVLGQNGNAWPATGKDFLYNTLPKVEEVMVHKDLQRQALRRLPWYPRYWRHRVDFLAKILEDSWGIEGTMQDLPAFPFWEINCTTFETGQRFRIRRDYMGDAYVGYVQNPTLPISQVMAASAAFPIAIGPYILKTAGLCFTPDKQGYQAVCERTAKKYSLWDGGVYDNLGLSPLYSQGQMDKEVDFVIVSNAGKPLEYRRRWFNVSAGNIKRLLDIALHQVDARVQEVFAPLVVAGRGAYVEISEDFPTTLHAAGEYDYLRLLKDGRDALIRNMI